MPKGHRAPLLPRTHSRTSSGSKPGVNLQFTQKDVAPPKHPEKPKKIGHGHDSHARAASPFPQVNSGIRAHSKEQIQPLTQKRAPVPSNHKVNGVKQKAGFTIASPGEGDEDDEWVSSESGAAGHDSDSDVDSVSSTPVEHVKLPFHAYTLPVDHPTISKSEASEQAGTETPLPRVATARPSDYNNSGGPPARVSAAAPVTRVPVPPIQTDQPHDSQHHQSQHRRFDNMMGPHSEVASPTHRGSRPTSKRYSVTSPSSTHSIVSRADHALRPHPLIRGQSHGLANLPPRPAPLAPLTVTSGAASAQISTSPPFNAHDAVEDVISTSPTSMKTASLSPSSPNPSSSSQLRRTSISSARSVATLPVPSVRGPPKSVHDRNRTLSAISSSSSSAALSSLVHLPTVSRPPTPQTISFFPPVNPHVNIEVIHPLLPGPYLNNHLTVLVRRTPVRESFDRVIRAKQAR